MTTKFSGPNTGEWQTAQLISKKALPRAASPAGASWAFTFAVRATAKNRLGTIASGLEYNVFCMITVLTGLRTKYAGAEDSRGIKYGKHAQRGLVIGNW
jgi:hypothetical protein